MPTRRETPHLIGREREHAALAAAIAAAIDGRPSVVLLSGEPGVGKSHLLASACDAASDQHGARVLHGFAHESGSMPPYFPLARAFASLNDADEIGAFAPVLGAAGIVSARSAPPKLSVESERLRLFETVATCCAQLASERPLLLTFDDLQWAEPALWDLLAYFARALNQAPALLIITVRGEVLRQSDSAAARAIAELSRQRILRQISLQPLAAIETHWLIAARLGGTVTPAFATLITEQSEGNPFFVEEILRDLAERGALRQGEAGWGNSRRSVGHHAQRCRSRFVWRLSSASSGYRWRPRRRSRRRPRSAGALRRRCWLLSSRGTRTRQNGR